MNVICEEHGIVELTQEEYFRQIQEMKNTTLWKCSICDKYAKWCENELNKVSYD